MTDDEPGLFQFENTFNIATVFLLKKCEINRVWKKVYAVNTLDVLCLLVFKKISTARTSNYVATKETPVNSLYGVPL